MAGTTRGEVAHDAAPGVAARPGMPVVDDAGAPVAHVDAPQHDAPRGDASVTSAELAAMDRALELARHGPAHGPNPRVGCILLGPGGAVLGEGWHAGAGTPHAEAVAVAAARAAGRDPRGATAVVTLEPCDHTGRTPPCSRLLLDAGIARLVYAVDDPNTTAAGGGARLRAGGVDVVGGVREGEGLALLRVWVHAVRTGRPFVTLKLAASLDGRVAASDGSSRWITSEAAREHAHRFRAEVDAIAVGTGTALTDDPALTARAAAPAAPPSTGDGDLQPYAPTDGEDGYQPLRVVVGLRDLPAGARLCGPGGPLLHLRTHEPAEVLAALADREVRHLLVEGGPTVAAAFLRAGSVDEIRAYLAPVLLGDGPPAVGGLGIGSIAEALRLTTTAVEQIGPDVLIVARPDRRPPAQTLTPPDPGVRTPSSPTREET